MVQSNALFHPSQASVNSVQNNLSKHSDFLEKIHIHKYQIPSKGSKVESQLIVIVSKSNICQNTVARKWFKIIVLTNYNKYSLCCCILLLSIVVKCYSVHWVK